MSEEILVGWNKEPVEIENHPLTLLFKSPSILAPLAYPNRLRLDPESCLYHMERVQKLDDRAEHYFRKVFEYEGPFGSHEVRCMDEGCRHTCGRIDLHLKYTMLGVPLVHVLPEAYLHPKFEVNLGDVFIEWSKGIL